MMKQFYVYTHARPDGSIFYVGKGHGARANDFSPSRRTVWHRNICLKHGRENLRVEKYPTYDEAVAFELEKFLISELRQSGAELVNLTDGGEGMSGLPMCEKSREAFSKWHGKYHSLSDESKRRVLDGLDRGRANSSKWKQSAAGRAHLASLGKRSAEALKNSPFKIQICCDCGAEFKTKSGRALACSKRCMQRYRVAGNKPSGIPTSIPESKCTHCGTTYTSRSFKKSLYCSGKCANAHWNAYYRRVRSGASDT